MARERPKASPRGEAVIKFVLNFMTDEVCGKRFVCF